MTRCVCAVTELREMKYALSYKLEIEDNVFNQKELYRLSIRAGDSKLQLKNFESERGNPSNREHIEALRSLSVKLEKKVDEYEQKIADAKASIEVANQNLNAWNVNLADAMADEPYVRKALLVCAVSPPLKRISCDPLFCSAIGQA